MNIMEQQGGLECAIASIIGIFFGIYNYKIHEITICKEYEKFENSQHNFELINSDY